MTRRRKKSNSDAEKFKAHGLTVLERRAGSEAAECGRFCGLLAIKSSRPLALAFLFDQHISANNHEIVFKDAQTIARTDGLFAVIGGDVIDNQIKYSPQNTASTPMQELSILKQYVATLGQKLLAIVSGNHDLWTYDMAGIDLLSVLFHDSSVFYARYAVYISIDVLGATYMVGVRHHYPGGGRDTPALGIKRWIRDCEHDLDVAVAGHRHVPAVEYFHWRGKWRVAVRAGSYQRVTDHAARNGFDTVAKSAPVVIFPGRGRMPVVYTDITDDAIRHLQVLRAGRFPDRQTV